MAARSFHRPPRAVREAARAINSAWRHCLPASIKLSACPSDATVAAMIEEHTGLSDFIRDIEAAIKKFKNNETHS